MDPKKKIEELGNENVEKIVGLVLEYVENNKVKNGFGAYENRAQSCRLVEDICEIVGFYNGEKIDNAAE